MREYLVSMTVEKWIEANDEDDALEEAKLVFEYQDLHYAETNVREIKSDS